MYMKYLAILILFASCKPAFRQTASGLEYRIVEKGNGTLAGSGSTVKVNYTWHFHDTLVRSTYNLVPHYQALIPGLIFPYDPMEVLVQGVREGDSVEVLLRADSLFAQGRLPKETPNIKPDDFWRIGIRVLKVYPFDVLNSGRTDSLIGADKKKDFALYDSVQQIRGPERINAYLQKKEIIAEWGPQGIAVEWIEKGKGKFPAAGAAIQLEYELTSLNGRIIDSNKDTSFHRPSPLELKPDMPYFPEAIDQTLRSLPGGSLVRLYIPVMKTKMGGAELGQPPVEDWVLEARIY